MPSTAENVAALVADGVRYTYTHLLRLLGWRCFVPEGRSLVAPYDQKLAT